MNSPENGYIMSYPSISHKMLGFIPPVLVLFPIPRQSMTQISVPPSPSSMKNHG